MFCSVTVCGRIRKTLGIHRRATASFVDDDDGVVLTSYVTVSAHFFLHKFLFRPSVYTLHM